MKKILALLLAVAMCLSLVACGSAPQQSNKNDGSIEEALEKWPWIADEWYTLSADEPVVVFFEDGSFLHGDESGTWTWESIMGGDDYVIPLTVYPDNGDSYLLTFYVGDNSSRRIFAENPNTGEYLYEEEVTSSKDVSNDFEQSDTIDNEATEPSETIDETVIDTSGESSKIIGEWKATNENCSLYFYENGTCVEGKGSPCEWYYDESTERYCIIFSGMTVSFVIETENGIRSLSSLGMFSPCSYVHADDYEKAVGAN